MRPESEFKSFFEENKDVIENLKIQEEDFEKVLDLISPANPKATTTSELNREIEELNLHKPIEVLLTINMSSIQKAFKANLGKAIFNDKISVEEITATSVLDIHKSFYKIFNFLSSSPNHLDLSLSTFLIALNLLNSSKLCDRTEVIRFATRICKKNKFSLQDVIESIFKSFYFYSYFEVEKAVEKVSEDIMKLH